MTKELSQKQKRFGREYMIDFNAVAAYVRAGYSEKGARTAGPRLLRDSRIRAYIAELEAEATERAGLTVDGVLKNLREDRDAASKGGQFGPAVRADELMGKHLAMFTDVSKNVVVDDISPEDAIRDLCTTNGILNVPAHDLFMQGLEALKKPMPPRNEDPTPPAPTQSAPEMIQ